MRASSVVLCVVGLLLVYASSSAAEMRKWTRKNGREFCAEFIKTAQDQGGHDAVILRRQNGVEMTLRMENLSEKDQQYVEQLAARETPTETKRQTGS